MIHYCKTHWQPILYGFFAALLSMLVLCFTHQSAPKIVTVDRKQLTQHFAKQLSQSTLSPAQKAALTDRFAEALVTATQTYAKAHLVVIVDKSLVLGSLPDITAVIAAKIKTAMEAQ